MSHRYKVKEMVGPSISPGPFTHIISLFLEGHLNTSNDDRESRALSASHIALLRGPSLTL